MIAFLKRNHALFRQMDFRLVNAFVENVSYDRSYQLPFNIISCRSEVEEPPESYIRNERTGKIWRPRTGQVLFIPYQLPIFIHRRTDFVCFDLHFTLEHFPGQDLFRGMNEILDLSSRFKAGELKSIFEEPDPGTAVCRMREFVFRICSGILPESDETKEWRFLPLTRMVRNSISADWTVSKMAEYAHLSVGAFSREFSRNMRCTAKQFLQRELLIKSLDLLQNTRRSIQSVSDELHFSSPFYFSKFFRKACGIPPSEYVRNCLSSIPGEKRMTDPDRGKRKMGGSAGT